MSSEGIVSFLFADHLPRDSSVAFRSTFDLGVEIQKNKREQGISLLSQSQLMFVGFWGDGILGSAIFRRSLRTKPGSKSTEAQSLLKQFPSIFREDYPRPFCGFVSFRPLMKGNLEDYSAAVRSIA